MYKHAAKVSFALSRVNSTVKYIRHQALDKTWKGFEDSAAPEATESVSELIGLLTLRGADEIIITESQVQAIWRNKDDANDNIIEGIEVWNREGEE